MRRISAFAIPVLALAMVAWAAGPAAAQKAAKPKSHTAAGTVKSVSAATVVVTGKDNKDMTFTVDNTTNVRGKGMGTKSAQKGGKPAVTDLLGAGDRVTVTYHDMGGSMHAAVINVNAKAVGK
jgi:hypothetical protein